MAKTELTLISRSTSRSLQDRLFGSSRPEAARARRDGAHGITAGAVAAKRGDGAFGDPSPGFDDKAFGVIGGFDDLDHQARYCFGGAVAVLNIGGSHGML